MCIPNDEDDRCPNIDNWHQPGKPGRCCCNCKNHLQDFYHCTTVKEPPGMRICYCSFPKGWICYVADLEGARAHSGWSKHGECEYHSYKELAVKEVEEVDYLI